LAGILFVDSRVADLDQLLAGLDEALRVDVLDPLTDGVGQIAAALDALSEAKKKAEKVEREAAEDHGYAEKKLSELQEAAAAAGVDEEVRSDIEAAALDVMELANRATRQLSEAQARMEDAAKKAEAVGAPPEEDSKVPEEVDKVEAESGEEEEKP